MLLARTIYAQSILNGDDDDPFRDETVAEISGVTVVHGATECEPTAMNDHHDRMDCALKRRLFFGLRRLLRGRW